MPFCWGGQLFICTQESCASSETSAQFLFVYISVTVAGTGVNSTCLLWRCLCFSMKECGRRIWKRVMRSWKILSWGNWVLDAEANSGSMAVTESRAGRCACPVPPAHLPGVFSQVNPLICTVPKLLCTAGGQERRCSPCPPVPKPPSSQAISPNPCVWAGAIAITESAGKGYLSFVCVLFFFVKY